MPVISGLQAGVGESMQPNKASPEVLLYQVTGLSPPTLALGTPRHLPIVVEVWDRTVETALVQVPSILIVIADRVAYSACSIANKFFVVMMLYLKKHYLTRLTS